MYFFTNVVFFDVLHFYQDTKMLIMRNMLTLIPLKIQLRFLFVSKAVVLKLGSIEPQGFGEAVAGVRLRSE